MLYICFLDVHSSLQRHTLVGRLTCEHLPADCGHRSKEQQPTPTHATLASALPGSTSRFYATAPRLAGCLQPSAGERCHRAEPPRGHVPVDVFGSLANQQHRTPNIYHCTLQAVLVQYALQVQQALIYISMICVC